MKMLLGKAPHSMDAKNRIRIPKKFKEEMKAGNESLHFVPYSPDAIAIMNDTVLASLLGDLDKVDPADEDLLNAKRCLLNNIEDVEEDSQGRTTLPKTVREYIGADQEHSALIAVGMGNYIEIWVEEKYNEALKGWNTQKAQEKVSSSRK